MIVFACDGCGKEFEVDAALAGRKARCEECKRVVRVPAARPEIESEPALPSRPAGAVPRRWYAARPKGEAEPKPWGGVDRDGWVALGVGMALAVVPLMVPLIGFLLFPLKTIVHESGHTATAWVLASPAVPSFDLTYGGGVSHVFGRQPILVVVAYGALGYFLFRARGDRRALIGWAIAGSVYTGVMFTPLRDLSIVAMGHGAELLLAGVFLFRALGGRQILSPIERPLYAALGFYFVIFDGRFGVGLMTDPDARVAYGEAKGGGHRMDFDRIAKILGWPVGRVACVFLLACILTPVAAYLFHRYGDRLLPGRGA